MEESKIIHFDELCITDEKTKAITVAIIGHGGSVGKSLAALEEIKATQNREIVIYSCDTLEEAKNLGVTAIIDTDNSLKLDDDLLIDKTFLELKNTMISDFEFGVIEKDDDVKDWSHPQGTKQKKFRKYPTNQRKKKKRR